MNSDVIYSDKTNGYSLRGLSRLSSDLGHEILNALKNPNIDEIMLNCNGYLFAETKTEGMIKIGEFDTVKGAAIIRTIGSLLNKEINAQSPILSGEIPENGSRFEGLLPPLVKAPIFSIRKHNALSLPLTEMIAKKMLTGEQADFLKEAIIKKRTIVISGRTGCGKTTLVNALLNELSKVCPHDRVLSIEDTPELNVTLQNKVALYTNDATDMGQLLRSSLRLRPDRIIVGEVRSAEALDLIDAFSTGHNGGFTTVHAGNIEQALKRLCLLISRHRQAPRLIEPTLCEALDIVIQLRRTPYRHITEIAEVKGFKDNSFILNKLFNNK